MTLNYIALDSANSERFLLPQLVYCGKGTTKGSLRPGFQMAGGIVFWSLVVIHVVAGLALLAVEETGTQNVAAGLSIVGLGGATIEFGRIGLKTGRVMVHPHVFSWRNQPVPFSLMVALSIGLGTSVVGMGMWVLLFGSI